MTAAGGAAVSDGGAGDTDSGATWVAFGVDIGQGLTGGGVCDGCGRMAAAGGAIC